MADVDGVAAATFKDLEFVSVFLLFSLFKWFMGTILAMRRLKTGSSPIKAEPLEGLLRHFGGREG